MAKELKKHYSARELSAFCLQISLLLRAAIPLDEGLSVMAEDAADEEEKKILLHMSEEVELGSPFSVVLQEVGSYPSYVIKMAKLGEETGTLDQMMASLSEYYEKESILMKSIKNAVSYPMAATRLGGMFSGVALAAGVLLAVVAGIIWLLGRGGKKIGAVEHVADRFKRKSRIALAVANRRFTSVLALTLHSGLELEKGMELAAELVENPAVEEKIKACGEELETGTDYYSAMKNTGLFGGFHVQMIKVGVRSGRLDQVMEEISRSCEEEADTALDNMVNRLEPTMVAVLAVAVGLILLSVMLPLVGVLSAIG